MKSIKKSPTGNEGVSKAEGIRTPVVAAPKQKGFRGAPKVPSKLRQKRPAITKVVDAYHDPVKPVEEVAYLSVDLPCTRTPVVVPKSQSLKPDVTTPEIRPAKPRQKGVYSTEDLESYYIEGYLGVLQNWIPKLVGLEEEKASFSYSKEMNNLG
ncbi:15979_t:CDS:2, partial [Gigaspora rosea]